MKKTTIEFLTLMAVVTGLPLTVSAQDAATAEDLTQDTGRGPSYRFGSDGQLAISSDAAIAITHASPSEGASSTRVTLAPAVDYFIIENLSIGGFISLDHTTIEDVDFTVFGIGPRVGYNIPLSNAVSVWPKVGFSFQSTGTSEEEESGDVEIETSTGNDGIALNLFVPIMFHPVTHFFAGFGPFLDADLSGDNKSTRLGARLTLGGWFEL